MTSTVVFPDVVALVIGHIDDNLATFGWPTTSVHKRVPSPRPSSFVTVLRTGGPARDHVVDDAQVTLDVWADEDADVADLTADVRAIVNDLAGTVIDGTQVYRVTEMAGPSDIPDPLSDQPRMRWSVVVQTRGAASTS